MSIDSAKQTIANNCLLILQDDHKTIEFLNNNMANAQDLFAEICLYASELYLYRLGYDNILESLSVNYFQSIKAKVKILFKKKCSL
jgi:hypothetical protein